MVRLWARHPLHLLLTWALLLQLKAQLPLGVALSVLCSQALPKPKKRLPQRMLFQLKKRQRLFRLLWKMWQMILKLLLRTKMMESSFQKLRGPLVIPRGVDRARSQRTSDLSAMSADALLDRILSCTALSSGLVHPASSVCMDQV